MSIGHDDGVRHHIDEIRQKALGVAQAVFALAQLADVRQGAGQALQGTAGQAVGAGAKAQPAPAAWPRVETDIEFLETVCLDKGSHAGKQALAFLHAQQAQHAAQPRLFGQFRRRQQRPALRGKKHIAAAASPLPHTLGCRLHGERKSPLAGRKVRCRQPFRRRSPGLGGAQQIDEQRQRHAERGAASLQGEGPRRRHVQCRWMERKLQVARADAQRTIQLRHQRPALRAIEQNLWPRRGRQVVDRHADRRRMSLQKRLDQVGIAECHQRQSNDRVRVLGGAAFAHRQEQDRRGALHAGIGLQPERAGEGRQIT